ASRPRRQRHLDKRVRGRRLLSPPTVDSRPVRCRRSADAQRVRSLAVSFNGEIYNHLDIRSELDACGCAPNWRGHSDTETLLYAVRQWGVEAALQRFIGMFAFVLWDAQQQTLTLCRDRFGEKPLFYGWCGRDLVFASELKALAAHPEWSPSLDRAALTAFMRYS